jgi:hypothetical protein
VIAAWVIIALCTYAMGWAIAGTIWCAARPDTSIEWQAKRALCWPLEPVLLPASYLLGRRRETGAHGVATLERAEAVPDDDAPLPLPPAISVEMRDPAFQARIERLAELSQAALRARGAVRARGLQAVVEEREADDERDRLLAQPLIAERRFTLVTHCQHGHVADHWLGRTTTDHVERICRFEQCAATWLEKR